MAFNFDNNLKLYLPGGKMQDFGPNRIALTNTGVTFAEGPFGYDVMVFAGAQSVTFASQSTNTVSWIDEGGNHRAIVGGATYYLNGSITTSFTNPLVATSIGVGYTGKLAKCRYFNVELSGEQIVKLMRLDKSFSTFPRRPQPHVDLSTTPDLTDPTLVFSGLNALTRGTANDASNEGNDGSITNGSFGSDGSINFTAGNLVLPTITFTTQAYTAFESDGVNRYVSNGTTIWKNNVSGATLPVTITSTGFTSKTVKLADVELYTEAKSAEWVAADYAKRVSQNNLLYKNA